MITYQVPPVRAAEPKRSGGRRPSLPAWAPYAIWGGILVAAFGVGYLIRRAGGLPADALAPLHAHARLLITPLVPAAAVALASIPLMIAATERMPWRRLLAVGWLGSTTWAILLETSDGGWSAVGRPLTAPTEYLAGLPAMGNDPLRWLRGFAHNAPAYPTHVKGHPPLPTLILWILQWTGLRGPTWAGLLVILVGTSAAAAVAITVRWLAGEEMARNAVPFLVFTPAVIWIATSMDALFLGVAAWGIALLALSTGVRNLVHRLWISGVAGVLLGALPYLSYGLLPLFAVPVAVLIVARSGPWPPAACLAGAFVVPMFFTLSGFWWFDGVRETHMAWAYSEHWARRPFGYALIGNIGALALLIGPATAGALRHLWTAGPRRVTARRTVISVRWLVGAALLGVLVLDLSGVTRGEVERIWLPYSAWIVAANAAHKPSGGRLAAQAASALAIQALVESPW